MIDPLLNVAFSVHHNKGAYALLLGSGVSTAAGIPTGWQVVLDLIRKLAALEGEECGPDPEAWFSRKYGISPEYSRLLKAVAKSMTERNSLLRSYFEPSEEEREEGLKVPTLAHKAIAKMVKDGYVRVILTTNFDRLLEQSLEHEGITPTVIATGHAADGARPLHLVDCTVVKLNGDYLDTRIKNTPEELAKYPGSLKRLLNRVLDEYGLIVCGWSGEWDTALRDAMERCKSHRFTTYWTARGKPKEVSRGVISHRRAEVVSIDAADDFFTKLAEKLASLKELDAPHPLSSKVAVATLKRYLVDERYKILLHDLVMDETERAVALLGRIEFREPLTEDVLAARLPTVLEGSEQAVKTLMGALAHGCFWGDQSQWSVWEGVLERVACSTVGRSKYTYWQFIAKYPLFLLLYCGGVGAVASRRYDTLVHLVHETKVKMNGSWERLTHHLWDDPRGAKAFRCLPGMDRAYYPVSDRLHQVVRPEFQSLVSNGDGFDEAFERFEYLHALMHAHLIEESDPRYVWGPPGRYVCQFFGGRADDVVTRVDSEALQGVDDWALLEAGAFGGLHRHYEKARDRIHELWLSKRPQVF